MNREELLKACDAQLERTFGPSICEWHKARDVVRPEGGRNDL